MTADRPAFALLGDPVAHSLSPRIHRAAFDALAIRATYEARRTDEEGVAQAVDEMRRGDLDGANVTMPLKSAARAVADGLSEDAARSGAVNTLVRRGTAVEGENTDVGGIRDAWERRDLPHGAPILVLGAGGAAGAALVALDGIGPLAVSARDRRAAAAVAGRTGVDADLVPWGRGLEGSVVVNATPIGMDGEPLPEPLLRGISGLLDMAYGSSPTPAVVGSSGVVPVADGLDLLVLQAARSFQLWFGRPAPVEAMEAAARR